MSRLTIWRLLLITFLSAQLACGGLLSGDSGSDVDNAGGARPAPHFEPGFNLFSPEQDIELGRMSAREIAQQVPVMTDARTTQYVQQLGAKLAAQAPGFKFPYQFAVVGTREINAFALPGGPIFVNAGTIAAAKNEGELAGVIAHEISHIALRHGTNQASKAYIAQKGLGILSEIVGGDGGDLGSIVNAIGGAGANMIFLKFGRTAETQADLEGARLLAAAGYDPRDMATFFEKLQSQGGGQRVPEMLSDHPDPGNRIAAINQVMPSLRVSQKPVRDSNEFQQVKARLTGGAVKSEAEPQRVGPRDPTDIEPGARPPAPSSEFQEFQSKDGSFALQYPANWDAIGAPEGDANLIFAPKGAYGKMGDSLYVSHGIFIGVVAPQADDLAAANEAFVRQQLAANPDFRVQRNPERIESGGRQWLRTLVAGPSAVTGVIEIDVIYTSATSDGRLFYLITMAPEDEFKNYQPAFERIIGSLRLSR